MWCCGLGGRGGGCRGGLAVLAVAAVVLVVAVVFVLVVVVVSIYIYIYVYLCMHTSTRSLEIRPSAAPSPPEQDGPPVTLRGVQVTTRWLKGQPSS